MIYNFYLYDRRGNCLFYREWNRPFNSFADNPDEDKRLVYGLLFSLKSSIQKLSGAQDNNTENINHNNDTLVTLSTNTFTLHHIETPSSLRLVLITDNSVKKNLRPQSTVMVHLCQYISHLCGEKLYLQALLKELLSYQRIHNLKKNWKTIFKACLASRDAILGSFGKRIPFQKKIK